MKKSKTPSRALVPLNPAAPAKAGLPATTGGLHASANRLPVRSVPRQPLRLELDLPADFTSLYKTSQPRRKARYRPETARARGEPVADPYDSLRCTTKALDYLLTPQLKRFLRYATIAVAIIVLADLLSSSSSGTACWVSLIQPAHPMQAAGASVVSAPNRR